MSWILNNINTEFVNIKGFKSQQLSLPSGFGIIHFQLYVYFYFIVAGRRFNVIRETVLVSNSNVYVAL